MAKKKNQKSRQAAGKKKFFLDKLKILKLSLPEEAKNWVWGILIFILAAIFTLSFFDLAGVAGKSLKNILLVLIGKVFFILPFIFVIGGIIFFTTKYKKFLGPTILAILIIIIGIAGILAGTKSELKFQGYGGWVGNLISFPIIRFFGVLVNYIVFGALVVFGLLIFWYLLKSQSASSGNNKEESAENEKIKEISPKPSLIKKIFFPKFKVKEIESFSQVPEIKSSLTELKTKEITEKSSSSAALLFDYQFPPIDLLDSGKEVPTSGDLRVNSAIIKKTLQNFDIPVEMGEVNIGPTVTQYTFKPAEGVKLSKITGLGNDLALALASHPIRIEAPIPGRSLVGVEVPNKVRAKVRLKDLISNPVFQSSASFLNIVLGRDVSGASVYADLSKMPHLLVAGSTGSGKTIFLNNLILSLLFRNSPALLKLILIDPKRVEFPVYNELPHLLAPVIYDATRSVNTLRWLISEMERRFEVLSAQKSRDIISYNQQLKIEDKNEVLPYIVLIIDELADLMAAKGREMEVGIVRLAQMARAVGIHLVLATQRPSVEVITGLIKANITSRVTFQVASQVDSRTVLDMAGAEKLLGQGDLLFLSSELGKPKRIQSAYVSDKEVKRVTNYIKSKNEKTEFRIRETVLDDQLKEELERSLDVSEARGVDDFYGEDPLYEEAKRVVVEAKKASASLLQRRLRLGYARAARLIDMLEKKGVVGPGEGAKPREILITTAGTDASMITEEEKEGEWKKI